MPILQIGLRRWLQSGDGSSQNIKYEIISLTIINLILMNKMY